MCALLAAMSIVLGKYLAIGIGDVIRISLENLPVMVAGFAFGPIAGLAVGVVADLVGCVLVGYAINPIITVGAAVIGLISGIYRYLPTGGRNSARFIRITATVFVTHAIGSVIIKTFGLAAFYDMPFIALMLWRALNYLIVGLAEALALYSLFSSAGVTREINRILPRRARQNKGKDETL